MLDHFVIVSKGGLVLWETKDGHEVTREAVNNVIAAVILEERSGENAFQDTKYTLKWSFANDYDLIFMVVYHKSLQLGYVDELLEVVKRRFTEWVDGQTGGKKRSADYGFVDTSSWDEKFRLLQERTETEQMKKSVAPRAQRSFAQTDKGQKAVGKDSGKKKKKPRKPRSADSPAGADDEEEDEYEDETEETQQPPQSPQPTPSSPPASPAPVAAASSSSSPSPVASSPQSAERSIDLSASGDASAEESSSTAAGSDSPMDMSEEAIQKRLAAMAARRPGPRGGGKAKPAAAPAPAAKKGGKVIRKSAKDLEEEQRKLDVAGSASAAPATISASVKQQFLGAPGEKLDLHAPTSAAEAELLEDEGDTPKKGGFFSSFFSNLTNRTLSRTDLEPVLAKFRDHLVAKNVASDIADKLCESVATSLVGTNQSNFKSITSTVKTALQEALIRILTPKRQIDILRDIQEIKASKNPRPYSIVFVGVNGVGKSTNLAKVCYWLLQEKLKVMIAACDTFRSGAVEQLRVHAQCLDVHLYQRGYGKDPANIANDAIRYAQENGYDVVLIDTAGRMEDNEPLMRALVNLVNLNNPDLILFVGEALVGNKAVDQLTKFNQCLVDMSTRPSPRVIDGILLTKFDTIDDKVGAALSMVYVTGQPIVFLGIGQHYHSLRTFSIQRILPPLLKVS